ncbi:RluA family pseudouridine synthase [Parasphingopyxis sp.]|uniref:RluA family pseudouridine synthase n=1 Tax=Parasphingopyxis sp. TaxID=1920299 RepID=UPI0026188E57|nr:RluA family pseudouridine synthase [Parasphingopyxis sp.]
MAGDLSTLEACIAAEADGWRLDRALAAALPQFSRERLKKLIASGHVRKADGSEARDPKSAVEKGQNFTVSVPAPEPAEAAPQDIPLDIVFEDEHLIVIDKPAGLVVHPAAGNADGTLVNALLHHCAGRLSGIGGVARPGIVHRIDKDTSGLIVAAKTDKAHEGLAKQFAAHSIDRVYKAIVHNLVNKSEDKIETNLARSPRNRKKIAVVEPPHGKHAITRYKRIEALNNATLIECRLETGRTHQIRVHMAHIGHSLIGDPVYGRPKPALKDVLKRLDFKRQALHAMRIGFIHPVTSNALAFDSELPVDIQELFRALHV